VIVATAAALFACAACADAAYTPHLDLDYNLDGPPGPTPANANHLDVYTPAGFEGPRPVVMYVHGGSWRAGDKDNQIANKVNLFTSSGYVFVSINYRLSPNPPSTSDPNRVKFPDHPHDVGEAIGWLDRNVASYGGDPSRIMLLGHSAGAHLVSLVSTQPSYREAYGVKRSQLLGFVSLDTDAFDISQRIAELGDARKINFYNPFGTPEENAETNSWHDASPVVWADKGDPAFLAVGQQGAPNRIAEDNEMATALGQDPASSVVPVPLDHEGINAELGNPNATTDETARVMGFYGSLVAASHPQKPKLKRKPKRRIHSHRRKTKVTFRLKAGADDASLECKLDNRGYKSCGKRARYRVRRGTHRFKVRATGEVLGKRVGAPGKARSAKFRVIRSAS
jgi:arylformamidase